jgi:hypothetical protein
MIHLLLFLRNSSFSTLKKVESKVNTDQTDEIFGFQFGFCVVSLQALVHSEPSKMCCVRKQWDLHFRIAFEIKMEENSTIIKNKHKNRIH